MTIEDYVSFQTSKLLKEKGFDETCRAFWKKWNGEISLCDCNSSHTFDYCHNIMLENYNDSDETNIAAPTLQMAMKWLRKEHNIDIIVFPHKRKRKTYYARVLRDFYIEHQQKCNTYISYEEACEAAIKYSLENLI